MYKNDYEDDSDNIKVEMAYSLAHSAIVEMLQRQDFLNDCRVMANVLFDSETEATQKLKQDILLFLNEHTDAVLNVVATFLIATKDGAIANAVIPLLNNVEIATAFNKDRFIPFANMVLSVLCCRTFNTDNGQIAYVDCRGDSDHHWWFKSNIVDLPEIKDGYRLPSQKPLNERKIYDKVTGSVMAKVENLDSDKCLEILGYLMNVKLCYSDKFLQRPEMILKEDASDEEAQAFEDYTKKLAEPMARIARNMAYFYADLIPDYRIRIYSRLDSVNYTSNKQARSLLMAYDKETVKVTDIDVDASIKVKLPDLDIDDEDVEIDIDEDAPF